MKNYTVITKRCFCYEWKIMGVENRNEVIFVLSTSDLNYRIV